jgi:phosphoesterase RecJ-like protein
MSDLLAVPAHRRAAAAAVWAALDGARTVALSTHVNADGDGCGSEAGLARLLAQRGIDAYIVNPTPWPAMFEFLLGDGVRDRSNEGAAALQSADRVVVLDISDVGRLGVLAPALRARHDRALVIDHHQPGAEVPGDVVMSDVAACATGELVYDFAVTAGIGITPAVATALYTALLTDTGSFRYSNTSPRCHLVAAKLLEAGVDPEVMYRRVYASVPIGRLHLLREALASLDADPDAGLAWIDIAAGALERHNVRGEDLDGLAEHPRSIAGTRLAVLFRDLGHGKVKVSFRSTTDVDAHAFARTFGGGGHARASGALLTGSLDDVKRTVLDAARELLSATSRTSP